MTTAATPGVTGSIPSSPESAQKPRRPSRWWMAGVPLAVAAMLTANGYRVSDFWYYSGLNHEIASGDAGEWVTVSEEYSDAHGDSTRDYAVRLAGLGGASPAYEDRSGDELTLPEGMVAQTVQLDFRADPDQPLKNCAITVVDDRGRQYRVGHLFDELGSRVTTCVPEETPGPSVPVIRTEPRGALPEKEQPRPERWSASPMIAVPSDAKLVELRISFENPDYVSLTLPR